MNPMPITGRMALPPAWCDRAAECLSIYLCNSSQRTPAKEDRRLAGANYLPSPFLAFHAAISVATSRAMAPPRASRPRMAPRS